MLVGECFIYDDNVYIKIRAFDSNYLTGSEQMDSFNCDTNCVACIYDDTIVEPVNMELNEV